MKALVRRWSVALAGASVAMALPAGASADVPTDVRAKLGKAAAPAVELKQTSSRESLGTRFYSFQQKVGGVPVLGGETVVTDAPGKSADLLQDGSTPGLRAPGSASLSRDAAIATARGHIHATALRAPARASEFLLPTSSGGRLVWRVLLPSQTPSGDFEVLVDARTGAVARVRDLLRNDTGRASLFDPDPVQTHNGFGGLADNGDADSPLLTSLRRAVTLRDLSAGTNCLVGRWVRSVLPRVPTIENFDYGVTDPDPDNPSPAMDVCQPGRDFSSVTRSDDRFEALMGYFHLDRAQRYIQSLGYSNRRRNGIVDRRILARADYESDDNSHYSTLTRDLTLGIGGVDDGEDAEVFIHEYGHAMQSSQSGSFGQSNSSRVSNEAGSIGEGFSDYFASSVSQIFHPSRRWGPCWSPWDNTEIDPTTHCERRVDSRATRAQQARRCPTDPEAGGPEIHCYGEAWSGVLWSIRGHVGGRRTDKVILQSQFSYGASTDFRGAARAILAADQRVYRGHDKRTMQTILCRRGFLHSPCMPTRRRSAPRFPG